MLASARGWLRLAKEIDRRRHAGTRLRRYVGRTADRGEIAQDFKRYSQKRTMSMLFLRHQTSKRRLEPGRSF
jgi:hypothetical protein